jgi:hypothetical protein
MGQIPKKITRSVLVNMTCLPVNQNNLRDKIPSIVHRKLFNCKQIVLHWIYTYMKPNIWTWGIIGSIKLHLTPFKYFCIMHTTISLNFIQ